MFDGLHIEKEREMKRQKLDINWQMVMGGGDGDEPPEIEIVTAASKTTKPAPPPTFDDQVECCEQSLTDRELNEQMERQRSLLLSIGPRTHDRGEKIKAKIKRLEEEKERRMLRRPQMDVDGCEKLRQSAASGSCDSPRQGDAASNDVSRSTFADCFNRKRQDTDCGAEKSFDKELKILGSESQRSTCNGDISQSLRPKGRSPSRPERFKCPGKHSTNGYNNTSSNGDHKLRASSPYSFHNDDDDFVSHDTTRKDNLQEFSPYGSRRQKTKGQTIINVDEEEPKPVTITEQAAELPESMKEDIYYPSRDDPEFVQVCRKDLECLSPEGYLTSPIMNFYIRFLQQQASPTSRAVYDCHFFNTYFYQKLKEAVTYKGDDKDAFFVKVRRWWKGVDLFRKAYILIPIHEDLHWSLVIICIPNKEDESGPIILHLDSLGFHVSRSIFENIKRFLKAEWNYLNQDATPTDLPISDRIWKMLPRRIDDQIIRVPQQKNDYDCGLFVLFFMERFIEEAPERLKKKDLAKFDKRWFRPEQASALRVKIRKILIELFRNSSSDS